MQNYELTYLESSVEMLVVESLRGEADEHRVALFERKLKMLKVLESGIGEDVVGSGIEKDRASIQHLAILRSSMGRNFYNSLEPFLLDETTASRERRVQLFLPDVEAYTLQSSNQALRGLFGGVGAAPESRKGISNG